MNYFQHIDFQKIGEEDFIDFIVNKHHVYTRQMMDLILLNVASAKLSNPLLYDTLDTLHGLLLRLQEQIECLIRQEEDSLFPFILALREIKAQQGTVPFLNVQLTESSMRSIRAEHASISGLMSEIKACTNGYAAPPEADELLRLCYAELQEFDQDLTEHFYRENEFLFPKMQKLEAEVVARSRSLKDSSDEDSRQ